MKIKLEKREIGALFAPFERKLIFETSGHHLGWVRWKRGTPYFKLDRSPFYPEERDIYYYLDPSITERPEENRKVEVDVGKTEKAINFQKKSLQGDYVYIHTVDNWKDWSLAVNDMPKPHIDKDDFLHYVSEQWINGKEDYLDRIIGMQLVSSPPTDSYFLGGINSKIFDFFGPKNRLRCLKNTMKTYLPPDFLSTRSPYYFALIESKDDTRLSADIGEKVIECNYTLLGQEPNKPIHLPLFLKDADYKKMKYTSNIDVLQYQLSALMCRPYIPESCTNKVVEVIRDVRELVANKPCEILEIDYTLAQRVALSLTRLELSDKVDDETFNKALNEWKDWYIKVEEEAQTLLRKGWDLNLFGRPAIRSISDLGKYTPTDHKIFLEIINASDSLDKKDVPRVEVQNRVEKKYGFNSGTVDDSLEALQRIGYIILKNNQNTIGIVDWNPLSESS
ncbi:MAG: hypothetical protein PHD13_04235 [Methanocellales archaeon]|nr:hypothetical protein [Methanocellales archaeon]MDD3292126.1 hypothetical protein [Methanocellales archaeon]MDD5235363.1 hypothetical protein [Methanocellales archaeon]MDD5485689.1 hypothetical protein [Methanocellales archaeon]